jgi:sugar/nucleoside kinase (ribokinase family)
MPHLALVGNLSYDLIDGGPPRVGGAPVHCGRALRLLDARVAVVARCAQQDEPEFRHTFAELGLAATIRAGTETTTFSFTYDGDRRHMRVDRTGDTWSAADARGVPRGGWMHVGALLRGDFSSDVLATLARGRRLSFDGQGLTRVRECGPLKLQGDPDPDLLRHISILKLAVEEAEALTGGIEPRALADLGPPEVLVTFGSDGSLVVAGGKAVEVRARHVDADPTGSGDAYAVGYLVSRAAGLGPVSAARRATALVGDLLRARIA